MVRLARFENQTKSNTISSPEFLRLFVSGYPGDQPLTKSRRNSGLEIESNMDSFQASEKTWLGVEVLLRDLQNLIDDHDSADVLFLVGKDEVAVYAHRLMLVARCNYFRNRQRELWSSKSLHSQLTVRRPEFRPDVFREVLIFVYTGKVIL